MRMNLEQWWKAELSRIGLFDFDKLDAVQLHHIARVEDPHVLNGRLICNHPQCDLSTALLVYARKGPDYYRRFDYSNDKTVNTEDFDLIKLIASKVAESGFKSRMFSYDPAEFGIGAKNDQEVKWDHLEIFTNPLSGERIEYDSAITEESAFDLIECSYHKNSFSDKIQGLLLSLNIEFEELYSGFYCLSHPFKDENIFFQNFELQYSKEEELFAFKFLSYIAEDESENFNIMKEFVGKDSTIREAMVRATESWKQWIETKL
jgi:Domain of unknown function (DUF4274)